MKIISIDRETSLVSATVKNQISKGYSDNNFVELKTNNPIQLLSSYSSEIVIIQKLPRPIAIVGNFN